jgi:hypothetical protein
MEYKETVTEALRRTRAKVLLIEHFVSGDCSDDELHGGVDDTNSSQQGLGWILSEVNRELYEIEKRLDQVGTDKGAAPAGGKQKASEDTKGVRTFTFEQWAEILRAIGGVDSFSRVLLAYVEPATEIPTTETEKLYELCGHTWEMLLDIVSKLDNLKTLVGLV